VMNLVVGRIADRAADWRQVIVTGAIMAAVFPLGLFFVSDFWGILLFWTLANVAQLAIGPVVDAAAMRMTARRGSDFGVMRAWGTLGYLVMLISTGYLVGWLGPVVFLPFAVMLALIRAGAALQLPQFRAPIGERRATEGATRLRHVLKPWFLLPLIGYAMVFATHMMLSTFQGLLFERQGISLTMIGILIALGALSETAMFFVFGRFAARFRPRHMILLSAVVTVLRWIAMGFAPALPVLIGLQLLHGITFALGFMACVGFITKHTSEDIAAEAQGFFSALQLGMSVLALAGFGQLADTYGAHAYFASAAFAALGGLAVWASMALQGPSATKQALL
jgi:MFS transporter, PPP family, 3-phenylpropionic acid transporter